MDGWNAQGGERAEILELRARDVSSKSVFNASARLAGTTIEKHCFDALQPRKRRKRSLKLMPLEISAMRC